jgi:hypothetical protein
VARAVAPFIRHTTSTHAFVVPSLALLDNVEPWDLGLFLEHLPADPSTFLLAVMDDGFFQVS